MNAQKTHKQLVAVAREIEAAWKYYDNDILAFAEIVANKTHNIDLSAFGELVNMTQLLENPFISSLQHPSTFSDLYLKLYDNGRFYVEILNWWGSDINIHDHDFSGMQFQLKGQSLNVEYSFEEKEWSPYLTKGDVFVSKAEIWNEGDRSFVQPGTAALHTVNHLSYPTVSLLIRTHGSAAYGPQRNYFPPFVAGSYGVADIVFRKRVGLLRLLSNTSVNSFNTAFQRIVSFQTPTENLFLAIKLYDILFNDKFSSVLDEYLNIGGENAETIVRAAAYYRATDYIINKVKKTNGFSPNDVLTCSVLGSCFDSKSLLKIIDDLTLGGYNVNLEDFLSSVNQLTEPMVAERLFDIFNLFGIDNNFKATMNNDTIVPEKLTNN